LLGFFAASGISPFLVFFFVSVSSFAGFCLVGLVLFVCFPFLGYLRQRPLTIFFLVVLFYAGASRTVT
jgi:hypothetical protein